MAEKIQTNRRRKSNVKNLEEERHKRRAARREPLPPIRRREHDGTVSPAPSAHRHRPHPPARPVPPPVEREWEGPGKPASIDLILLLVIISLVLFGIVMVFSSSYYYALTSTSFDGNMYHFVQLQALWSAIGFVGMAFMIHFPYRVVRKFSFAVYLFALVTLVLVLLVGEDIQGSRRWLGIGPIGFQPSEVAKIAVIIYLSDFVCRHQQEMRKLRGFLKCAMVLLVPTVLVAVENLSTAIVIFAIGVAILFVASPKIWYFVVAGVGASGLGAMALLLPQFAYRMERVRIWLDPFSDPTDDGFQIIQSLYAVASGGLFGLGLGQSRQKMFVPEPYNDIIFAIICEELGLVGAAVVIALFAVLIWRGAKIAMESRDLYGTLVAVGIVMLIGVQVVINIAVATNSMPNTGMQLPFISYGGSGMVFTLGSMGILLNISRYRRRI